MADLIGQAIVNVDVRPIRAAYLVTPRNASAFKTAVGFACDRWGGLQEPIIPVPTSGRLPSFWAQVLELARPDVLVTIGQFEGGRIAKLGRDAHINVIHEGEFRRHRPPTIHPLGVHSLEEANSLTVLVPRRNRVCEVAAAGSLDPSDFDEWHRYGPDVQFAPEAAALADAQLLGQTPAALTVHQCGELTLQGGFPMGLVWIAAPGSLTDATLFWNWRALMPISLQPTFAVLLDAATAALPRFAEALRRQLSGTPGRGRPAFTVCSRTVSREDLRQLVTAWGFAEHTQDSVQMQLGRQPDSDLTDVTAAINFRPFVPTSRTSGVRERVVTQLYRPTTTILAASPVHRNPQIGGTIRVRISGPAELNFAGSHAAAKLAHPNALPSDEGIELETFLQPSYQLILSIPERQDVLAAILGERGITSQISDKGKYTRGIQRLTTDLEMYSDAGLGSVIAALTRPRSNHVLVALRKSMPTFTESALLDAAASLSSDAVRSFRRLSEIASATKLSTAKAAPLVGQLLRRRMAERGVCTACNECGMRTFIPLEHAAEPAICPGCTSAAEYEISPGFDPVIYYRLNSLLGRASDQGVIAHLFGIAGLLRRDPAAFVLPAADLFEKGKHVGEADILALSGSDLLFGEAKSSASDFGARQLARDTKFAKLIGATTYVAVCTEALDREMEDDAYDAAREHGLRLVIIDGPVAQPRNVERAHTRITDQALGWLNRDDVRNCVELVRARGGEVSNMLGEDALVQARPERVHPVLRGQTPGHPPFYQIRLWDAASQRSFGCPIELRAHEARKFPRHPDPIYYELIAHMDRGYLTE
jgi:hypothetical protein